MQKSVYDWYIYIEDIKKLKIRIKRNEDLSTLQQKMEHNREVFFSSEVKTFNKTLLEYIERSMTKSSVKSVFKNFQIAVSNNSFSFFLHLICIILGKVDDITLTNCRIQTKNLVVSI